MPHAHSGKLSGFPFTAVYLYFSTAYICRAFVDLMTFLTVRLADMKNTGLNLDHVRFQNLNKLNFQASTLKLYLNATSRSQPLLSIGTLKKITLLSLR